MGEVDWRMGRRAGRGNRNMESGRGKQERGGGGGKGESDCRSKWEARSRQQGWGVPRAHAEQKEGTHPARRNASSTVGSRRIEEPKRIERTAKDAVSSIHRSSLLQARCINDSAAECVCCSTRAALSGDGRWQEEDGTRRGWLLAPCVSHECAVYEQSSIHTASKPRTDKKREGGAPRGDRVMQLVCQQHGARPNIQRNASRNNHITESE